MNYTYKTIAAVAIACGIFADSTNAQGTNSVPSTETAPPQVAETVTEEAPSGPNVYAFSYAKNGYLCDGYLIYDDIVLQSGAGVTWYGFDVNVFNSWAIGRDRTRFAGACVNEVDWQIDYSNVYKGFFYKVTLDTWTYPDTDKTFDEWLSQVNVAWEECPVVRPSINARFGIESQQGCYITPKIEKTFNLNDSGSLTLNVYEQIGYGTKSWIKKNSGLDKSGFNDNQIGATINYQITGAFGVNAGVEYNTIINSNIRDRIDSGETWQADNEKDHLMYFAGASLFF